MQSTYLCLLLMLCVGVGDSFGFWFWNSERNPALPNWTGLSVTWLDYKHVPMTETLAAVDGWWMDKGCTDSSFFRGKRYRHGNDTTMMLLFDSNGLIAGVQTAVSKSVQVQRNNKMTFVEDNELLHLTAYFTDPEMICNAGRRDKGFVGEKLLFQLGSSWTLTMNVPLEEKYIYQTQWTKGNCFLTMGHHYWYGLSNGMNCSEIFPAFLLYNNGKLNGFGWLIADHVSSPSYENPKTGALKLLMDNKQQPHCLSSTNVTVQHVFLEKSPYWNRC